MTKEHMDIEEQVFKPEEEAFIWGAMERVEADLKSKAFELIEDIEKTADQKFSEFGIEFENHSPVNRDYLAASLLDILFAKLHEGDKKVAEWIIYNLKGQAGLLTEEDRDSSVYK